MAKKPKIGCLLSTLAFGAFIAVVYFEFLSHHHIQHKLGPIRGGLLTVSLFIIGCMSADFTWRIASDFYSFKNLWMHYFSLLLIWVMSSIFYKRLIKDTTDVGKAQRETLLGFIKSNLNTDYGKDHDFSNIHSVEDFRRLHSLTYYDHYEKYIDQIYNGKDNVIGQKKPYVLAMTSGTSGQPKMLPTQSKQRGVFFLYGILPIFYVMFQKMPGIRNLQKKLKFFYTPRWRKSPSGIRVGPNSSSPIDSKSELSFHSTPSAAFDIITEPEALYVYLLFGLRDKKLGYLEANFASMVYTAFVTMEKNWRSLVNDIRMGSVKKELEIDWAIRQRLNNELSPDPERANELESEFERGFLGIAQKIWPCMNFILCVDSGAFQVYGDLLRNGYCKGLQIYSPIYAATEGLIGINLWPSNPERRYLLPPRALFYEFIPLESAGVKDCNTLLLHELKKGEEYEMVVTNASGLCRYRFGDVVRVVDHLNEAPLVEFMYRQGQLLNVRGEKTSEKSFFEAFEKSFEDVLTLNQLVDYCCCEQLADADNASPCYHVFLEVSGPAVSSSQLEQLTTQLDEDLKKGYIYKSFRDKGSIGKPVVYLVREQTFSQYRISMIDSEKATPNQFKVPRVLKKPDAIKYMRGCSAHV